MENITIDFVRKNFKNQSAVADKLNISRQAVSKWFITGNIPRLRQFEIMESINNAS